MTASSSSGKLTNLQLELLKIYSFELSEEELLELKKVIARFFAERVKERTASIWTQRGYTQQQMDEWLNDEKQ